MRILIVKMSSMGDVVHAQPLAVDLRRRWPDARIEWVVERPFAAIPKMNPAVDDVIPIAWRKWRKSLFAVETRRAMAEFHDALTMDPWDLVIDCQGLIKSAVVSRLAPATERVGPGWAFAREPIASLAYDHKAIVPRDWHVVRRNRAVGAAVGDYRVDDAPRFGLAVDPPAASEMPWLAGAGPRRALLVTGASRDEKLWPESHWVDVAVRLQRAGLDLIWFWGADAERVRAERLASLSATAAGADQRAQIVPPFLTVHDAARVIAGSTIVVGLDTGFTHLAAALGRPTIGIFCDFDAVQCAVTGDAFCASFGGIGVIPTTAEVIGAIDSGLAL